MFSQKHLSRPGVGFRQNPTMNWAESYVRFSRHFLQSFNVVLLKGQPICVVCSTPDLASCLCCFSLILCFFKTLFEGEAICFLLYSGPNPILIYSVNVFYRQALKLCRCHVRRLGLFQKHCTRDTVIDHGTGGVHSKTRILPNQPKITQTNQKPAKPPINQPNHPTSYSNQPETPIDFENHLKVNLKKKLF